MRVRRCCNGSTHFHPKIRLREYHPLLITRQGRAYKQHLPIFGIFVLSTVSKDEKTGLQVSLTRSFARTCTSGSFRQRNFKNLMGENLRQCKHVLEL
jgi:hypothetical protein